MCVPKRLPGMFAFRASTHLVQHTTTRKRCALRRMRLQRARARRRHLTRPFAAETRAMGAESHCARHARIFTHRESAKKNREKCAKHTHALHNSPSPPPIPCHSNVRARNSSWHAPARGRKRALSSRYTEWKLTYSSAENGRGGTQQQT